MEINWAIATTPLPTSVGEPLRHSRTQRAVLRTIPALMLLAGLSAAAHADDYGCKVMLCMANPKGPMAEATCRPPIERLLRERAQRRPPAYPSCPEASPSTMAFNFRLYNDCPAGSAASNEGEYSVQMSDALWDQINPIRPGTSRLMLTLPELPQGTYAQVGVSETGTLDSNYSGVGTDGSRNRVCVSGGMGLIAIRLPNNDSQSQEQFQYINVVRQQTLIPPNANPRSVDIYIDGKLFKSTSF